MPDTTLSPEPVEIACGGVFGDEVAQAFDRRRPAITIRVVEEFAPPADLFARAGVVYVGACFTGGGSALGLIPTLVGNDRCHVVGARSVDAKQVRDLLTTGHVVFGVARDSVTSFVNAFCDALELTL